MNVKKILYITLAVLLTAVIFAGSACAVEKEEVAYINLENDGSVEHVYVVNIMELNAGQSFTDYGNYSSVRNMVSNDQISISNGVVTGSVSNDLKLFYEGDFGTADIPWDISIAYYLNGNAISADDIAGKSGYLAMYIDIVPNPYVDSYFYKNYALQITATLDSKKCMDISANGATIANVGANKQLTFTQMPNKESHIVISSNVVDFSMPAMTINGIHLSMDFDADIDDTKKDMQDLEDGIVDLDDGLTEVQEGINKLMNGQMALESGALTLSNGAGQLIGATTQIQDGASELFSNSIAIQNVLLPAICAVTEIDSPATVTENNYSTVMGTVAENLYSKAEGETGAKKTALQYLAGGIESRIAILDGQKELNDGIFVYTSGVLAVASGANKLATSEMEMTTGVKTLLDGINKLKDGSAELREKTTGMSDKLSDKLDEVLDPLRGGNGNIPSYVSSKNTEIKAVQFAMHTNEIKVPEKEKPAEEVKEELNFFQRILKLFGL